MSQPAPSAAVPVDVGRRASDRRGWLRRIAMMSDHRFATRILAAIAFADSSFLPIPPDLMLIPMGLTRPERLWRLAVICTVASSLGAVLGYLIGYWLWGIVGAPLIDFYGYSERFAGYQRLVAHWGFAIIIAKAFTPIPFKIAAIAAGVGAMNPVSFMIATVLGRALHFAMVAAILNLFGARAVALIARYERRLAVISVVVLMIIAIGCYLR